MSECGERYYHATPLDTLGRLLETGQRVFKSQLSVQVVGLPA